MDPDSYWVVYLLIVFSFLLIALASLAEVALASFNQLRLRQVSESREDRLTILERVIDDPEYYLATFTALKAAAIITGATALTWLLVWQHFPVVHVVIWLFFFYIAILIVKIVARGIAMRHPDTFANGLAPSMRFFVTLLRIITAPLLWLGKQVAGKNERGEPLSNLFFSEDGLQYLMRNSVGDGLVEEEEREMIGNIFAFSERLVREVMVSRLDMVALPQEASFAQALQVINRAGHSRIPVYHNNIDQVVGLLYAKDLLKFVQEHREDISVQEMMRPDVYFVPESKRVSDLLNEMRSRQVHIAIVVDEYGGTAGLATIEDLVEEIVGEIQDEYDSEPVMYEEQSNGVYEFDARLNLDEVNEILGSTFMTEGETLGGFIYDELETIPQVGQFFETDGWRITVLTMDGQRIGHVRIEKITAEPETPDENKDKHHLGPLSLLL